MKDKMHQYDERSQRYTSKEGGVLQAAYLERAIRKNKGFLRRVFDKTIVPTSQAGSGENEFDEWKKKQKSAGCHGSSIPSATRSQAHSIFHSQAVITAPRVDNSQVPIMSSDGSSQFTGVNEQSADPVVSSSKENQEIAAIHHLCPEGDLDQNVHSPASLDKTTQRDENTSQIEGLPLPDEPISPVKPTSIPLQPPNHTLKVPVSEPPPTIKEFTAQRLPISSTMNDFEAQSGLLQAHMLECALQKHAPPLKKAGWLKKTR